MPKLGGLRACSPRKVLNLQPLRLFLVASETATSASLVCVYYNVDHAQFKQPFITVVHRPTRCGNVGKRLLIGLYYIHLHKWMQFYPRENFLFLRLEDVKQEPHRIMTQITGFLDMDAVSEVQAENWLSGVVNARKKRKEIDPDKLIMRPESKTLLEDFFKPYNIMLADFIGDQRFLWKDT